MKLTFENPSRSRLHRYIFIGTTWTQEMVWLIANGCDFEGAQKLLRERVPFLE